jgi:hypothetical protein
LYTVDRLVTSVLFTSFVVVCWYPCHPSPSKRNVITQQPLAFTPWKFSAGTRCCLRLSPC